ncbi:oxidoreductase [Byssothecium circinans]|uniref:Oxidoreductase n=1 Tax=Byssothecium circinans TaxID=147558 RepID=A0A6A5TVJ6_9PLEO|nr:oxidoreductase [Byssothecium circinans]
MAGKNVEGVALITGAASGIGKDTAFSFAESGARRVIFADSNDSGAHEAAQSSKRYAINPNYDACAIHVEITDEESVQNMVDETVRKHGRIDNFVHSAGISSKSFTMISGVSLAGFDGVVDVSMKGTLLCNRGVLKLMGSQEPRFFEGRHGTRDIGRGAIVNVGSMNSLGPLPGKIPYTASKHGVTAITKTAALEGGRLGIRANMRERNPQLEGLIQKAVPCGRMAMPDEVSETIVFLCSPAASYITGQALVIDNGISLKVRLG